MIRASAVAVLCVAASSALAQPKPDCKPLAPVIERARAAGEWQQLTHEQWAFLRGIYVLNPETLPGLPMGDAAAMVKEPGNDGATIVFIDGETACTPMPIPKVLVKILEDVAAGKINHQGDPL